MQTREAAKVLSECWAEARTAPAQRPSGCGRVYVVPLKASRSDLRRAAKSVGMRWLPNAYGIGAPCLYVGYDNAHGRVLAQGEKLASLLNERGIECYMDAVGD